MPRDQHLSRRERQIMDVLHARQAASAADILAALPDPPSYSAVRALLRILEAKGHIRHREEGGRYVYLPTASREAARRSALKRVLSTFFGGAVDQAVATLLDVSGEKLSAAELSRLQKLIDRARKEGK